MQDPQDQEGKQKWPRITERGSKSGSRSRRLNVRRSVPSCFDATRKTRPSDFREPRNGRSSRLLSGPALEAGDRSPGDRTARVGRTAHHCRFSRGCVLPRSEKCLLAPGTRQDFEDTDPADGESPKRCAPITPACLVKIVKGAVEYASRSASRPIPTTGMPRCCSKGSIPRLARNNSHSAATASRSTSRGPMSRPHRPWPSRDRIRDAGGHFIIATPGASLIESSGMDDEFEQVDLHDEEHHT